MDHLITCKSRIEMYVQLACWRMNLKFVFLWWKKDQAFLLRHMGYQRYLQALSMAWERPECQWLNKHWGQLSARKPTHNQCKGLETSLTSPNFEDSKLQTHLPDQNSDRRLCILILVTRFRDSGQCDVGWSIVGYRLSEACIIIERKIC